jgi:hypothetical protein
MQKALTLELDERTVRDAESLAAKQESRSRTSWRESSSRSPRRRASIRPAAADQVCVEDLAGTVPTQHTRSVSSLVTFGG